MALFDVIISNNNTYTENFKGYSGDAPTNKVEYDALDCWTDKSKAPTWATISSAIETEQYHVDRRNDYPSIGDQIDMIYKDMKNSTTTHADAVEVVKTKWPKDGSGPMG